MAIIDSGEHVVRNRATWNATANNWVSAGERSWSQAEPTWGCWAVPNSELELLPPDMSGLLAIELGCGTGYVSSWMARRGAQVVGIDVSENQLETARRLQREHGLVLELLHANAEALPFEAERFDFAISEYGAALWANPDMWLREAHRVLKPGAPLNFLTMSPFAHLFAPVDVREPFGRTLLRDYFGLERLDWGDEGVEFNRTVSAWFKTFREVGFEVVDYFEPRPKQIDLEVKFGVPADWAYRFPHEQVWKLKKRH
jgi:SAM-dependent methyltransferase